MKRFLTITIMSALCIAQSACIKDNRNDCTSGYNAEIRFRMTDTSGQDIFLGDIYNVDVGIFDCNGVCVETRQVSYEELHEFAGMRLTLDPGIYHIVCWANSNDNTHIEGVEQGATVQNPKVVYNSEQIDKSPHKGRAFKDADKLYYAPMSWLTPSEDAHLDGSYIMTVPEEGMAYGTLDFIYAHRTIEIYIDGYDRGVANVERENVPAGLGYFGQTQLTNGQGIPQKTIAFEETTPYTREETDYQFVSIDTFNFDHTNDIVLEIVDPATKTVVYSTLLNDAMKEAGEDFSDMVIALMIKFSTLSDGSVSVSVVLPNWTGDDVDTDVF
jgi:hypothetical protein